MGTAHDRAAGGGGAQGVDLGALRADFALLDEPLRGRPAVYLDNASTTQKPEAVIRAEGAFYRTCNANVHRAVHGLAEEATRRFEAARAAAAAFIGADDPRCIVFTRGATESINLVARGWAPGHVREGDEILLTEMEHHSNLVPWQAAAQRAGAVLRFLPVTPEGVLDLDRLPALLGPRTRLVALAHVSNVLGTVNPVRTVADAAHAAGAVVLVDGAQGVPHLPVDVRAMGCDFFAFSAHKMCGPTGVGVLYGRPDLLEATEPLLLGGEMIRRVEWRTSTWTDVPHRFEAGTPHVAGVVGFGAALEYLRAAGMDRLAARERELTAYALGVLDTVKGLRLLGRAPERAGVFSFDLEGVHPHDLAQFLDHEGIAVRAGHLCAQPLLGRFGLRAATRASLYLYNTGKDIDRLAEGLAGAAAYFAP